MTTFTIISYKSDAEEYCRGCRTDSHGPEFEVHQYSSLDEAANEWASKFFNDRHQESWRASWELTLMVDGYVLIDRDHTVTRHQDEIEKPDDLDLDADQDFLQRVGVRVAQLQEEHEERLRMQELRKAQDAEEAKKKEEAQRRAKYEELKKEFGGH